MGIGDEIIASGHALKAYERDGRRVLITDRGGRGRWSALWQGLNWIAHPELDLRTPGLTHLQDGPQCRPYIRYPFNRQIGMRYSGWRVRDNMGFIQLTDDEMKFAIHAANVVRPFTIIEPLVKPSANPNKQWGRAKWQKLANLLNRERMNPIQIGGVGTVTLEGVRHVATKDFRYGAALMKLARWSFLPDGGLHHAAAVLGVPATVVWGGTNDPDILGYPSHENIFFPTVCGVWTPCAHCRTIWDWLPPELVFERTMKRMEERYGKNYRMR